MVGGIQSNFSDEEASGSSEAPASISREPLHQEPSIKVVSCKHSIFIYFPKDRDCEVCKRTKIIRAPCRKRTGNVVHRAEKCGDLITGEHRVLSGHAVSVKVVTLETIFDLQSWCRTWPPIGSSRIRAKQKLLRKHRGACKSSWSQIGTLKSFSLTIPWNVARPVKISPGIIVRRHHTDRRLTELLKEQCAE